jgi:hypothetical protein
VVLVKVEVPTRRTSLRQLRIWTDQYPEVQDEIRTFQTYALEKLDRMSLWYRMSHDSYQLEDWKCDVETDQAAW